MDESFETGRYNNSFVNHMYFGRSLRIKIWCVYCNGLSYNLFLMNYWMGKKFSRQNSILIWSMLHIYISLQHILVVISQQHAAVLQIYWMNIKVCFWYH